VVGPLLREETPIKIYIKIDIKTAPTCFGAVTIIRGALFELVKVTVVTL
jgi:hypothetical protein